MTVIKLCLLTYLFHILDDFVLQPICLSKLKQKSWWDKQLESMDQDKKDLYKEDYKTGLSMHAMSWSTMILIPWFPFVDSGYILLGVWFVNYMIHYYVDDLKANKGKISLSTDQLIHIIQIAITNIVLILTYE